MKLLCTTKQDDIITSNLEDKSLEQQTPKQKDKQPNSLIILKYIGILGVGFLLSYGLIKLYEKYVKNENKKERSEYVKTTPEVSKDADSLSKTPY